MYRNIIYNINKEDDWTGEIILYTWDIETKERVKHTIPHQSYLFYKDDKGKYKSIFNDSLCKKIFKNSYEKKKWADKNNEIKLFESLSPVSEFLLNYFYGVNEDMDKFAQFPLRTCFLDIEIAVEEEFPKASEAKYPINLITLYDTFTKRYYSWALHDEFDLEDPEVTIKFFSNEAALLADFLKTFAEFEFDVYSGWNCFAYDYPYIINRCERILGEGIAAKYMSPIGKIREKEFKFHSDGYFYKGYKIEGVSVLDYMLIYKKFTKMVENEKPSYALDEVGQDELGYGKVAHEGSFKSFYKTDFKKFLQYNKRDVEILVELDKKRRDLELARYLCNYSLTEYESIYYNLSIVVGNVIQQSRKLDKFIPSRRAGEEESEEKLGAFVFEPTIGKYDGGVCIFDVKSLYPNTMITLNVSPEKLIGKIIEEQPDKKILRLNNGKIIELDNEKFTKLMEGPYALASNKAIFECKTQGIIPMFLSKFFDKRVEIQNHIKKLEKLPSTPELEADIKRLDSFQKVVKIILNSAYGSCGTPYSPWYSKDMAEAITLSGQFIAKSAMEWLTTKFKNAYGHPETEAVILAGDTDSVMFNVRYLAQHVIGDGIIDHTTVKKVSKEIEIVQRELNDWCAEHISKKVFHGYQTNRIKFETECICDVGFFFKKKRYLCHIVEKEGKLTKRGKDDLKFRGISLRKSTYPKMSKEIVKTAYEHVIYDKWNESQFTKFLSAEYEKFKTLSFEQIAVFKNINSLSDDNDDFLDTAKGTTGHAKAAIYYNQLLDRFKLTSKYYKISNNSKIRLCYISNVNDYNIPVIAFADDFPSEFKTMFIPDYKKQFELTVLAPLEDFFEANRWNVWTTDHIQQVVDVNDL